MRRRQFVKGASASLIAASVAGCSGILGGDGGGGSGPEDAVEAYLEAGVAADEEGLEESIHPDASQEVAMSGSMMSMASDLSITDSEVVEEDEESAIVEVSVEAEIGGETSQGTSQYEVRKNADGEWKVYAIVG